MRGRSLYHYLVLLLLLSLFNMQAHADTVYFTFDSSVTSGLKYSVDSGANWSPYVDQVLSVTIGEDMRFYSVQTEITITFDLPSYHPGVTATFDPVASGSNGPFPLSTYNYGAGMQYTFKTSVTGNTVVSIEFAGDQAYFNQNLEVAVGECTEFALNSLTPLGSTTSSTFPATLGVARGTCTFYSSSSCYTAITSYPSNFANKFFIKCTGSTTSVSTYTTAIKEFTAGLVFLDFKVGSKVAFTGPSTIGVGRCSSAFKLSAVTNNPSTITYPNGASFYADSSCSIAAPTTLTTNSTVLFLKFRTTGNKIVQVGATGQLRNTFTTPLSVVAAMDIVVTPSASCYKASTGKASVSVTGGPSSTYTYRWSTGQTTSSISNLAANNYTVTITSGALSEENQVVITEAPAIIITPTQTNVKCYGGSDGTASVTVSGGSGSGYSYVWSPSGGTTGARTGLAAGVYSLTVTDSQGCSAQETFTINQPAAALTFSTPVKTDILCPGGNTGTASMSVTGGTGTYKYSWSSNGGSANSATGLSAGTYTLTVTDDNQCSNQQSVTLTAPAAFVTSQSKIDPLCNGQSSGTATATITSGGTSPYTYVWSNGAPNVPTATSLTSGSYSVVLSDANSCSITTMYFFISQPDPVIATTATVPVQCNGAATGKASVTIAGGTQPYTYLWSNGAITDSILSVAFGTYTVAISDANNCPVLPSASLSLSVTQPDVLSSSEVHTDVFCNGRTTGTATITVTGGTSPYQYSWSPQPSSITANGASATSLSAQTYTVTITDGNGCSIQQQIIISQPAALTTSTTPTHILCYGEQGSVSATGSGGTAPYTYSWTSIGASTSSAKVSQPGSYAIVLTDAHGCTAQNTVVVNGPTAPLGVSIAKVDVRCNGDTTGSATPTVSGGTSGYTYAWSNGASSVSISSLAAATYNLTVTDANACSATKSVVVKQGTAFESVAATVLNPKCYGGTGSITLLPLGGTTPYTYEWFPVTSSDSYVDQLSQGVYVAYITDACSIKRTKNYTITQPNALEVIPSQNNVACYGYNSGSASVYVIGGKTPYSYSWSNGKTTATITGLSAGSYDVTITDKNGCLQQASFTITQPDPVLVTPTVTPVMCKGGNTGAISLLTTGGSTRYTYQWAPSSGGFSSAINQLTAGSYSVIVTDTAFCSQQQTYVVNEPSALAITTSQVNVMCKGEGTGSISIAVSGGTPGYVYSWTPNVGSGTSLTKLSAGKYVVTVTDANGCSLSSNFTITEPASICKNGGVCSGVDQCLCGKGWNGTDCSIPVCSSPCLNKGTCVGPDTCSCTSDMTGPVCIIPTATTKAWWTVKLVQVYKQESSVSPTTYGEMLAENMNIPSTAVVVSTQESASLYAKKSMPYIKLICVITLNETGTSINRTKELVLLVANSENITKYLEDSGSDSHINYIDDIDLLTQSLAIESPIEEKPKSNSNGKKRVGLGVGLGLGIPVVAAAIGGLAYFGYKKKAVTNGNTV